MFEPKKFIDKALREIRAVVGEEKVVSACSGGVDSSVTSLLIHKAIGKRLLTVFVDDGLRRIGEPEFVVGSLKKFGVNIRYIDERKIFFRSLRHKTDAEEKRRAFRHTFYNILGKIAKKEKAKFLAQGTIAADIREAVGGVKTQHNVLDQIGIDTKKYGFKLLEPLKRLYKPEVRRVARKLGLPKEISERMPFPGPALSIRILGEVTPEKIRLLKKATKIVEEETKNLGAFQSFAVLHDGKATGIKKGKRVYGNIITIRIVRSKNAITAKAMEVDYKILKRISRKLIREIPSLVRCLFDITDKPPATIEFE